MKTILLSLIVLSFALPANAGGKHHHKPEHVSATPVAQVTPEAPTQVAPSAPTPDAPVAPETKATSAPTLAPVSNRTTLAGDLGIKYNLGRDVNLTAKYGTDNRYGLALGYQATPSFGLEAEAYRKDSETAVRAGLIYTLNPVAPLKETKTIDRVVIQEKVVDRPVYRTIYRDKIKVVPYKPSNAPRGRG